MGGRKQWVKQQDQRHQGYVHAEETLEALELVMMGKDGMESYAQLVIDATLKIRRITVKDVVL
jgi:hypothetical protein